MIALFAEDEIIFSSYNFSTKRKLKEFGIDDPFETVAENYKNGAVERIGQHVRSLFPEID